MSTIGASISLQSVGPSGNPDIAFSNAFFVGQTPWGIANQWQICASFQDYVRLTGGLNKLASVAAGTTADTFTNETNALVVQNYYNVKAFFDEKQAGSPGVLYFCRVIATSAGPTAASKTFTDGSGVTTATSKWPGIHGATTQVTIINPSPRKGIFVLNAGTITTVAGTAAATGTGFTTGSTWNGYGIQIGANYYNITSVATSAALTLSSNATASVTGSAFAVGSNTNTAYVKFYHPQSNITEEWDISNNSDAANVSKKSQLCTFTLAASALPYSSAASKLNSGSAPTADGYAATDSDYVGTTTSAGVKTGLQVFNDQRLGTGFVGIPGKYSSTIRSGISTHCSSYFRHGILGSGSGLTLTTVITDLANQSNQHLSYWWPQLWVSDQNSDSSGQILVDTVGHMAGLGARMDKLFKSPHKSFAGTKYALTSALDVERTSSGAELCDDSGSNTLADYLINTLRVKGQPGGIVGWGLRSLSSDARFRQIPSSRVTDYVYLSGLLILEKFTMDEISLRMFGKVKADLDAFMSDLHDRGGLYGNKPGKVASPSDAWFCACDQGNNPGVSVGNGELHADLSFVATPNAERITLNLAATAPGFIGRQQ